MSRLVDHEIRAGRTHRPRCFCEVKVLFRSILTGLIAAVMLSAVVAGLGGFASQPHSRHLVPATEVLDGKMD